MMQKRKKPGYTKAFSYTDDRKNSTEQLMRLSGESDEELKSTAEFIKKAAHIMDFVCHESLEWIGGEHVKLLTLTPAILTDEERGKVVEKVSRFAMMLQPGERIHL